MESEVPLDELTIDLGEDAPIHVGNFIDRDAPPYAPVEARRAE